MSILGFSCTVLITWEGFLMYGPNSNAASKAVALMLAKSLRARPCKVGIFTSPFISNTYVKKPCSGGPAGIIYGYIFVWIGTLSVFLTLAEATSM